MSQINYEQRDDIQVSRTMITFKEYYMKFIGTRDPQTTNGWGWFVDIELNSQPIKFIENNGMYKQSQNVSIPEIIKEYPSIRSMKSMKNLQHTSQIDEDDIKHRTNKICSTIIGHSVGIISLFICYFIIML